MAADARAASSIVELGVFLPTLFLSIWISIRHGFGLNSGWIYLVILSLIRIVDSACQLATNKYPTSIGLHVTVSILNSVGLSPLLLTASGLLSRVNRFPSR
ncbi:hypothetical protein B7463_g8732, partial [Scytalidium lignicola]